MNRIRNEEGQCVCGWNRLKHFLPSLDHEIDVETQDERYRYHVGICAAVFGYLLEIPVERNDQRKFIGVTCNV